MSVPVGEALIGRVVNALGRADRRQRADRHHQTSTRSNASRPALLTGAGEGAAADRYQGHRRDDPYRPRPARADHWRPPDRKNRGRARHHHQSKGRRHDLHLCRHRPEALHRGAGGQDARRLRRHGLHASSCAATASDPAPMQYIAPYAGCAMGEYFRDRGTPCASDSTTIFPNTPRRIAKFHCCCAVRQDARPIPATFFTCIAVCWSAPPN